MTHNADSAMVCDEGSAVDAVDATIKPDEGAVTAETRQKTEKELEDELERELLELEGGKKEGRDEKKMADEKLELEIEREAKAMLEQKKDGEEKENDTTEEQDNALALGNDEEEEIDQDIMKRVARKADENENDGELDILSDEEGEGEEGDIDEDDEDEEEEGEEGSYDDEDEMESGEDEGMDESLEPGEVRMKRKQEEEDKENDEDEGSEDEEWLARKRELRMKRSKYVSNLKLDSDDEEEEDEEEDDTSDEEFELERQDRLTKQFEMQRQQEMKKKPVIHDVHEIDEDDSEDDDDDEDDDGSTDDEELMRRIEQERRQQRMARQNKTSHHHHQQQQQQKKEQMHHHHKSAQQTSTTEQQKKREHMSSNHSKSNHSNNNNNNSRKRSLEKVEIIRSNNPPKVATCEIDTNFVLPPASSIITKKIRFEIPTFTPRTFNVRPSLDLPIPGCAVADALAGESNLRVVIRSTTKIDFANIGKLSGDIFFTPDADWPESTARLALYYWIGHRNICSWANTNFVTIAAEKGKESKIGFVVTIDSNVYMRDKGEGRFTLGNESPLHNETFAFVAVVAAEGVGGCDEGVKKCDEGLENCDGGESEVKKKTVMRRSAEECLVFEDEEESPKRPRRASGEIDDECITLD